MNTQRVVTGRQAIAGELVGADMLIGRSSQGTAGGQQSPVWDGVSTLQAAAARLENLAQHLGVILGPVLMSDPMANAKSDVRPTPGPDRAPGACDLHEALLSVNDRLDAVEDDVQRLISRLAI